MTKTPITTIPGAKIMNGVAYLETTTENLRRVDQLPAKDALIHEQVYRMVGFAQGLAAEIARFKAHTFADVDALDAMLAQEYGVTRKGVKGNRTFTSADGRYRVSVKINTPDVIGPELQQAKALIDEIVLEKGADADPVLAALVAQVFNVGKQGRVNVDMLRRLRNTELDDPRWPRVRKAIDDAIKDGVSKAYITFHKWRDGTAGGWQMIPLDMAAVEITDDAFDHPSLRRQVEDLQAQIAALTIIDDDTPFHQMVAAACAMRFDLRTLPVSRRLSAVVYLADSARDLLRDLYAGNGIAAINAGADQDAIADAVDGLNDIHIALSEIIGRLRQNTTAQAAE